MKNRGLSAEDIKDLIELIRMVKRGHSEDFIVHHFKKVWLDREKDREEKRLCQ